MTQVLGDVIARSIHAATGPLLARIAALESKEVAPVVGPSGPPGKDIDPIFVKALVAEAVSTIPVPKDGAAGRDGKDGASVDVATIQAMVDAAVKALPVPKNGTDGKDGTSVDVATVKAMVTEAVSALPVPQNGRDGKDGTSVDPATVKALVVEVVAAIPVPKDGTNGRDGKDGKSVDESAVKAMVIEAVKAIPIPKDGQPGKDGAKGDTGHSVTSALVNKDGCLVLTFSDGTVKEVGVVVGKDGTNGKDGVGRDGKDAAPVDMLAVKSMVLEAVDAIPKPKDGTNGTDGLGFEDMEVVQRGARGVTLKFARGERVKSFDLNFPAMLYRGIYDPATTYEPGDVVTRQGSMWHCHAETSDLPGEGSKSWQLCVKRGGTGPKGEQGPKGVSATRDLTQMDPNTGAKW